MDPLTWQFAAGLLAIAALAAISISKRYLSVAGALAGVILGLGVLLAGGLGWLALLAAFALLGSALTRLGPEVKGLRDELSADRGLKNVLANGLPLLAFALAYAALGRAWAAAYVAGVGAATSDTISTEVGMLSRSPPRRITRPWEKVVRGVSGGVTPLGLAAGALAAAFMSAMASAFGVVPLLEVPLLAALGFLGDIVDSLLGDTLEAELDAPGRGDPPGFRPLNNHTVNLASVAASGLIAALLIYIR